MNTRRRPNTYELIKTFESVPASLGVAVARAASVAIVLAACTPFLRGALAQEAAQIEVPPAKSAVSGVVTRVDPQGQLTALVGISVKLSADSQRAQPLSMLSDVDGRFQFS